MIARVWCNKLFQFQVWKWISNSIVARDGGFVLNLDTCQVSLYIKHTLYETGRWRLYIDFFHNCNDIPTKQQLFLTFHASSDSYFIQSYPTFATYLVSKFSVYLPLERERWNLLTDVPWDSLIFLCICIVSVSDCESKSFFSKQV